jgi:hypothetical protein
MVKHSIVKNLTSKEMKGALPSYYSMLPDNNNEETRCEHVINFDLLCLVLAFIVTFQRYAIQIKENGNL